MQRHGVKDNAIAWCISSLNRGWTPRATRAYLEISSSAVGFPLDHK